LTSKASLASVASLASLASGEIDERKFGKILANVCKVGHL
jgi:hypothetical protein